MRFPRLRLRTQMAIVGLVAVLIWGGMMGTRSFIYFKRASSYTTEERGWRRISPRRDPKMAAFASECATYFAGLAAKYRYAMWHPWLPVGPDPYAPGVEQYLRESSLTPK